MLSIFELEFELLVEVVLDALQILEGLAVCYRRVFGLDVDFFEFGLVVILPVFQLGFQVVFMVYYFSPALRGCDPFVVEDVAEVRCGLRVTGAECVEPPLHRELGVLDQRYKILTGASRYMQLYFM
ncbi:hypothetical protein B0T44_09800 [Nocardia donostiensis]|uniref:Uncharacterized protein n=1 Tax=Nocardia donostiensis TaxID=1538463 RepID=A0A1V2TFM1_9NOCA|nr:hypothetical protein B0T46_13180 [Nocardia donostiensis]OQS20567.1 hypothetical protein B0T44_09800 [Nocardia donostiensis]